MNQRTILFLILLLGFRDSFATIVSATILKSLDVNKEIILLEDVHFGVREDLFDPSQREHLGTFLHNVQKQTDFILELPTPNLKILSFYYKKIYFYSWIMRKISYLLRRCPIVRLREPHYLIDQLFVDSVDNKKTWKMVNTITTADTRNDIDRVTCSMVQELYRLSPGAILKKTFKEMFANNEYLNYSTKDPVFAEIKEALSIDQLTLLLADIRDPIMLLINGMTRQVTVSRYNNRLAELDKELDSLINALAEYSCMTDAFIAMLKQKKAAIIDDAHTAIEPYIKKKNYTISQLACAILKKQKSFDNAFPALEALSAPAIFLSDLGFLQKIADGITSEKTKTIILFAGLRHTLNVETYLKQLGYYVSAETPLITVSKEHEAKVYNLKYWPLITSLNEPTTVE